MKKRNNKHSVIWGGDNNTIIPKMAVGDEAVAQSTSTGNTSFNSGHSHQFTVDQDGNGETSFVNGHKHAIVNNVVQESEGHFHQLGMTTNAGAINYFKVFAPEDKLENVIRTQSEPLWSSGSGNEPIIREFYTGSIQKGNTGKYYLDVHSIDDQTKPVEFAVTYGHSAGSGSEGGINSGETNPTKAIYSQFRQILLPPEETRFNFHGESGENHYPKGIYGVVVNRARYRERFDPGNWELRLGYNGNTYTYIDDSDAARNPVVGTSKREFWVVSGSIDDGIHTTASASAALHGKGAYGLFYPETGMILLNGEALTQRGAIKPELTSSSTNDDNHKELFNSVVSGAYFAGRREEQKRTSYYFCRVENDSFNHSQNPSYVSGANAEIVNTDFIREPKAYITTVGLYNSNNELLAVAKLSQPFLKDENTEALIKVKLDY